MKAKRLERTKKYILWLQKKYRDKTEIKDVVKRRAGKLKKFTANSEEKEAAERCGGKGLRSEEVERVRSSLETGARAGRTYCWSL